MPRPMSMESRAAWAEWSSSAPEWAFREFKSARGMKCSSCGSYMASEIHEGRKLWLCMECEPENARYSQE